jgi:peptidoglycan/xylan/chitin deacetylase (PgdA/CDA1 family)
MERRRALGALAGAALLGGTASACGGGSSGGRAAPKAAASGPPTATPTPDLPSEVVHGPRTGGGVALTFHGAGDPKLADRVLKTLEDGGAHVTVLAVGTWLDEYPQMARRILDGGHELGNHTQNHVDIDNLSPSRAYAEIAQCAERLRKLTGSIGTWFRPSQTQYAPAMVKQQAKRAGYATCLSYDLDSTDFKDPGAQAVTRTVLGGVQPGSIVSMHFGHPGTLTAMPSILDGLRSRHLTAVTVSKLLVS